MHSETQRTLTVNVESRKKLSKQDCDAMCALMKELAVKVDTEALDTIKVALSLAISVACDSTLVLKGLEAIATNWIDIEDDAAILSYDQEELLEEASNNEQMLSTEQEASWLRSTASGRPWRKGVTCRNSVNVIGSVNVKSVNFIENLLY